MFFKPSAAKVAKAIYKEAPSIAGTITAAMSDEYSAIEDEFGEDSVLPAILIDITAESLIRGMAVARGEQFAHKVGGEYNRLSPTFAVLSGACFAASTPGDSQERVMAEFVLNESKHRNDARAVNQLEQFFAAFRQKTLEIVGCSL